MSCRFFENCEGIAFRLAEATIFFFNSILLHLHTRIFKQGLSVLGFRMSSLVSTADPKLQPKQYTRRFSKQKRANAHKRKTHPRMPSTSGSLTVCITTTGGDDDAEVTYKPTETVWDFLFRLVTNPEMSEEVNCFPRQLTVRRKESSLALSSDSPPVDLMAVDHSRPSAISSRTAERSCSRRMGRCAR